MKTAYFNCSSGIAGDIIIASLLSAGLNKTDFENKLVKCLGIGSWHFEVKNTNAYHFPAKQLLVIGDKRFTNPNDILKAVSISKLPAAVKERSIGIISALINAESRVHRVGKSKVHFHELGSLDTIVDVTGAVLGMHLMGIDEVVCSEINIGRSAPATLELIKSGRVPVYSNNSTVELATPTGVAIMSKIVNSFGDMPLMEIVSSGFGAGLKEIHEPPNILRVVIGNNSQKESLAKFKTDEVVVLETNIDDMDPRIYPYVSQQLFDAGAKDVWLTQVLMKKGRPGIVFKVICAKEKEAEMADIIFKETTTLGIRRSFEQRYVLERSSGLSRKTAILPNGSKRSTVEYELARKRAIATGKALKTIID